MPGRPQRLPVARGIWHPGQRPIDRAHVQVPGPDGPVIMLAVFGVDPGQHHVPQFLQRCRAERLPPGRGDRRGGYPERPLPGHQRQVAEQGVHHRRVIRLGHQRHQQGEPDRQRRSHRPPRLPVHLADQLRRTGDLVDDTSGPGQRVQPVLGQAEPGVISRMPGGLHPPVAAHHRPGHRHRLAEHHRISAADLPARPSPARSGRPCPAPPRPAKPGQPPAPLPSRPRPAPPGRPGPQRRG